MVVFGVVGVIVIGVICVIVRLRHARFDARNRRCRAKTKQQGGRKRDAIVTVKLQLGQQITRGDADEGARAKRQGVGQDLCTRASDAKPEQPSADWDNQRKQRVHRVRKARRTTRRPQ